MGATSTLQAEHNKAMACLEKGDFAQALVSLKAVMGQVPGNEEIGRALRRLGRAAGKGALGMELDSEEALALYRCSLDAYLAMGETIVDPVDCNLLRVVCFNLGTYYHRLEQYPEAIRHYQDAFVLGPQHIDTPTNLAACLTSSGRALEAVEVVNAALKYNPTSADLLTRKKMAMDAAKLAEARTAPKA
jgi:tetratricopeptide (TPR) repeat protein